MVSAAALPLAHLSGINRSKPMTIRRQINVSLVAIVGEGLLSRLSFGLISFTLPLYARHLGLSLAEVGVLAALNSAVAVGLKPFAGWAADRFGLKRIYLVSIGIRSLVSFFLCFATAPWELFAIRSVHGLSMSLRDPSANALIAEHGGEKSVASAFAWYQTARTVAGSMSRAFAGILLTITGAHYSLVFLVAFALSVLPLLSVARYLKEDRNEIHVQRHVAVSSIPSQRFEADLAAEATPVRPKVLPFVGLGFLIAASAETRSRARTMSWMSMGEDAGGALAPVVAGFLWANWGIAALMGARVLLALAAEGYAFVVTRPVREAPVKTNRRAHAHELAIALPASSPTEEQNRGSMIQVEMN